MMGNIDLNFLVEKEKTETLSTEEQDFLRIAQCNGNTLLEETDFYIESGCFEPGQPIENSRKYDAADTFKEYRLRVIKNIIQAKSESLKKQWPNLDLEILAKIIDKDANHVVDISGLMDELIPAMLAQTHFNEKAILLFARVYVVLFNFGKAHEDWVKQGENPVLPDNKAEDFVSSTLALLVAGDIKISVFLDSKMAYAVYDPESDTIFFQKIYLNDLFFEGSANGIRHKPFHVSVLHELYHTFQDQNKLESDQGTIEIEAELFGMKADIIIDGYDLVKESLDAAIEYIREESRRNKVKDYELLSLFFSIIPEKEDSYDLLRLDLAKNELDNGKVNSEKRLELRNRYLTDRGKTEEIFPYIIGLDQQLKNPVERQVILDELNKKFKYKSDDITTAILAEEPQIPEDKSKGTYSPVYIFSMMEQLIYIYLKFGIEEARKFFVNLLVPAHDKYYLKSYESLTVKMDGISKKN